MIPTDPAVVRYAAKVRLADSGCVEWIGARSGGGYGQVRSQGRQRMAHRVAYEQLVGPVPDGLDLDHLCRNRACVNVLHLEPVTRAENIRRGVRYSDDECNRGHAVAEHGYVSSQGKRRCRICDSLRTMNHRRKRLYGLPPLKCHPSEVA